MIPKRPGLYKESMTLQWWMRALCSQINIWNRTLRRLAGICRIFIWNKKNFRKRNWLQIYIYLTDHIEEYWQEYYNVLSETLYTLRSPGTQMSYFYLKYNIEEYWQGVKNNIQIIGHSGFCLKNSTISTKFKYILKVLRCHNIWNMPCSRSGSLRLTW